ncbi:hypothetical protein EB796_022657 [Bugula neritina]|uniref:CSN8/PSMD8/EIF3K domain-containing protein n=1 Tax=Bugula neritina TaxID=10212 RepID=A0A7J7IZU8_BUGNE|nr:hypothetical protein EB796_022657 [Bugula neritina]
MLSIVVCHLVGISFQTIEKDCLSEQLGNISDADLKMWISKYGWEDKGDSVFITNQEELVKTKKITEKISFDSK